MSIVFTPHKIGNLEIKNRLVHSATHESMATETGEVTDELIKRLFRYSKIMLDPRQSKLATNNAKLGTQNPILLLKQNRQSIHFLNSRLQKIALNIYAQKKSLLSNVTRTLNAISPLQTLERGYSITLNDKGTAILSARQIKPNDTIETRLHNGRIISRVETCVENDE